MVRQLVQHELAYGWSKSRSSAPMSTHNGSGSQSWVPGKQPAGERGGGKATFPLGMPTLVC